jgi:pilus assembly protein CpaC
MNRTANQAAYGQPQRLRGSLWAACLCLLIPVKNHAANLPLPNAAANHALIQIAVEVVEVDEQKIQRLGVDWINAVIFTEVPAVLNIGGFTRTPIKAAIEALVQEGAADLLANPKLVTRNGTTATFHAGGELPYATNSGSNGSVSIEFKPYGVNLRINPRLEDDNHIAISFAAEVSGPDDQNSVTLSGNTVPGLRSRTVSSDLTLMPGSTLTMAGLLQNQKQSSTIGVPGLMHIPFLGVLFRHVVSTKQRTSIVVFITPSILDMDRAVAPSVPASAVAQTVESTPQASTQDNVLEALDGLN